MNETFSAQAFTTDWLGSLLAYPFRDPAWKRKLLVGLLLYFAGPFTLLITILPVSGYTYRILRRLTAGDGALGLPEWADWGGLFQDGLKIVGAGLVYALPLVLLSILTYFLSIMPLFAVSFLSSADQLPAWLPVGLSFGSTLLVGVMGVLLLVVSVVYMFAIPAALAHLAATGEFRAAFEISEWFPLLRANLSGFAVAGILPIIVSYLGMFVSQLLLLTVVLCFLYPVVVSGVSLFTLLYSYALYGLAYRVSADRLRSKSTGSIAGNPGSMPGGLPAALAAPVEPAGDGPAEG